MFLCEIDYKGQYIRFALTEEEFVEEFEIYPSKRTPTIETLQPLVHLWAAHADSGDVSAQRFFTDMAWGLSESDIENKNYAYVDLDRCKSLRSEVEKIIQSV